jgi:hypothetical protein
MRYLACVLCAAGCFPFPEPPPMMTGPDGGLPAAPADLADVTQPVRVPDLSQGPNPSNPPPDLAQPSNPPSQPDLANPPTPPNWSALSDSFDNGFQSDWNTLHSDQFDVSVSGSALVMTAHHSLWYQASEGPLVYKTVPAGDFMVTSTVHARKASDGSQMPDGIYSLGGIMARRAGTPQDYVFIVIGRDGNDLSVEHKSTDDDNSDFMGPTWPSGDVQLRICRVGTEMRLYKRAVGAGSWTQALARQRTDLAGELQVGAIVYANNANPDLTVRFDELDFAAPGAGDCP